MKKTACILLTAMSLCLAAATGFAMTAGDMDIHGFVSMGYTKTTDNNFFGDTEDGSFEFNEFGINFASEPTEKLRVGLQLLARDFGSNGNNDLSIDWAYGDYRWQDWLGIRAGKVKTPKGLYNETRDIDLLRTAIFLPQSVYPEILRDMDLGLMGAGIYGYIGLNAGGALSYQFLYGSQSPESNLSANMAMQGTTYIVSVVEIDSIKVDSKYAFGLVWETPLDGLRLGITYDSSEIVTSVHSEAAFEFFPAGTVFLGEYNKYQNTVISAEYAYGDLVLAGEYIQTAKQYNLNIPAVGISTQMDEIIADGWYLSASNYFTNWFALGGYYSEGYNDTDDRDGENVREGDKPHRAYFKDLCLTTAFTINSYWSIKLEGHLLTGTYGVSPVDQVQDANIFAEEDWSLFAVKTTFSF